MIKVQKAEAGLPLDVFSDISAQLSNWIKRIKNEEPTSIITISRKGTRLLEVISKFVIENSFPQDMVTTDIAVNFEPSSLIKNRRIAVIDDIVIWGTTMRYVKEFLESHGAKVSLFTVALHKDHAGWIEPDHVISINERKVTPFCDSVVSSIRLLNKPYDIEYPIFYYPFEFTRSEFSFYNLPKNTFLNHLTFSSQKQRGLLRATIDQQSTDFLRSIFVDNIAPLAVPVSKFRLFGSIHDRELLVVPMFVFHWPAGLYLAARKGKLFIPKLDFFNKVILEACDILENKKGLLSRKQKEASIARLCAYFVNYFVGTGCANDIIGNMDCGIRKDLKFGAMSNWDIQLVFGRYLGPKIQHLLDENTSFVSELFHDIQTSKVTTPSQTELFYAHRKQKKIYFTNENDKCIQVNMDPLWGNFLSNVTIRLKRHNDIDKGLLDIFKAMREVYDVGTRNKDTYIKDRLHHGITFYGLEKLLNENGIESKAWQISAGIDYLVDSGAIVPFYITSKSGEVIRVYRFGEDLFSRDKAPYTIREILSHIRSIEKQKLSLFRAEKTTVFLLCSLDKKWKKNDSFVSLYWDRYGARTEFRPLGRRSTFPSYCKNEGIAELTGSGDDFDLIASFNSIYPPEKSPLDPDKDVSIIQNQIEVFTFLTEGEADNKYTLALTTCFDEEAAIKALDGEVENWIVDPNIGIHKIIEKLDSVEIKSKEVEDIIWNNSVFSRQISLKYNIFVNLSSIVSEMENKFKGAGRSIRLLRNIWSQNKGYISPNLNVLNKEKLLALYSIGKIFGFVNSILQSYYNNLHNINRILSIQKHREVTFSQLVNAYNKLSENLNRERPEYFSTIVKLQFPDKSDESGKKTVLLNWLRDLRNIVEGWKKNIETIHTSLEKGVGASFVVAYDWIGSSDVSEKNRDAVFGKVNEKIKLFLERNGKDSLIEFPNTPNDGQHVIVKDVDLAWSLARFLLRDEKIRLAIFHAIGPDELFLDSGSGKTDGDAHAYAARMLGFSKNVDGKLIILHAEVYNRLKEKGFIKEGDKVEKLGKSDVKGERLRDIDIVLYYPSF